MSTYTAVILGEPVAQGRPRFSRQGGFVKAYDPAKSRDYKSYVRMIAAQHAPVTPVEGAIEFSLRIYRAIPKGMPKYKREAAKAQGRETKVYLHWSAGHYGQFWDEYHVQIDKGGEIYVIADGELDDVLAATYLRNSGSVSLCILGCLDAGTNNLGPEPPTAAQIEGMAQAIAAVCNGLWLTIDKQRVLTHGEAADNEDGVYAHKPYGPKNGCERWDLEYLGTLESPKYHPWSTEDDRGGDILRGKANWYRKYWKDNGGTPN